MCHKQVSVRPASGLAGFGKIGSPPDTEKFPRFGWTGLRRTSRLRLRENFDRFNFSEITRRRK
jgi:hypothetical protein